MGKLDKFISKLGSADGGVGDIITQIPKEFAPRFIPHVDPDDSSLCLPDFAPEIIDPDLAHLAAREGATATINRLRRSTKMSVFQLEEINRFVYDRIHENLMFQQSWAWENLVEGAVNRGDLPDPRQHNPEDVA